ncbi:hypothetical protein [Halococcus thailandensis]|uniref:hypothetical protein n=1 Tax=Halococcus thailandensis TaxID=335952 RepID=UPI001267C743|nr:hypothetical protein [Halococcus thailandensis]
MLWRPNRTSPPTGPSLVLVVGIAVFYRAYTFVFPASMIGIDPDGYAVWINQLVASGSIEAMNVGFYAKASFFPLLNGLSAIISGLPVRTAMIIIPLLAGILIPLSVYLLSRYITHEKATEVGIAASLIATVAAQGVHHSFWPISQSLATLFLCLFVVVSVRSISGPSHRYRFSLLFVVFLLSMALTHKLPMLVTIMFAGMFIVLTLLSRTVATQLGQKQRGGYNVWMLFGMIFMMAFIQWSYISNYLSSVVAKLIALFGSESASVSATLLQPTAAVSPFSEIVGILLRNLHALALLVPGAVAWLILVYTNRSKRFVQVQVLQAVTAGLFLLFPVAIVVPSEFNYSRVTLFIEPFLAVLIAAAFIDQSGRSRKLLARAWSMMVISILMFVVVTQPITVEAAPDFPGSPRMYLTSEEVAAKEFGHQHMDNSATDPYYAGEQPFPDQHVTASGVLDTTRENRYTSLNSALYNATLLSDCPPDILYRQIDVYRFQGPWRLTWDPKSVLDTHYNRIYTNHGAKHYSRVRCVNSNSSAN